MAAHVVGNIRAGRYIVAQTNATCPSCLESTRLVAVGLPPGHEVLECDEDLHDDDIPDAAGAADAWAQANHAALLFHVAYLSENVRSQLAGMLPAYCVDTRVAGLESCWTNHCGHCGAPFDDQELFCEPGGAFLPDSAAAARLIHLLIVEEPIRADAAGYAHEPQFFDSMQRI
jgi:hypothetical protein